MCIVALNGVVTSKLVNIWSSLWELHLVHESQSNPHILKRYEVYKCLFTAVLFFCEISVTIQLSDIVCNVYFTEQAARVVIVDENKLRFLYALG